MFASIYVTAGTELEAKNVTMTLLDKKLIACANIFPINSLYYWENKLQEDNEFALIMKTRVELVETLIDELKEIHSYDVPCIVSWPIDKGNSDYLSWITKETQMATKIK